MLPFFFHSWVTWIVLLLIAAAGVATVSTRLQYLQERRRTKKYEQRIVETKERPAERLTLVHRAPTDSLVQE